MVMKTSSNVTVVIPCFNDGAFINEAIQSILNQTLKPDQIIVVDDGSEDDTKAVLKAIKEDTVTVMFQSNTGVSSARNVGISQAETDYILTLDADDIFEPTFMEKALQIMESDNNIAVVGCYYRGFIGNTLDAKIEKPLGGKLSDFLVKNNGLGCSLFRKKSWKLVSGYDENMLYGYEDWEFWINILKEGQSMYIIEEPLFKYRTKKNSRDKNAIKYHDYELREYIFNKHKNVYLQNFESFAKHMLYQNSRLRNDKTKLLNATEVKIGKAILLPFRVIKSIFKK